MPVFFDYDHFTITPWREPIRKSVPSVDRTADGNAQVSASACVNLTYMRPRYAAHGSPEHASMPEAFVWQRWTDDDEDGRGFVNLELFDADAVVLHPHSTRVSSADLFFAADADESLLDRAAHAFARRLAGTFTDPVLLWLVPDFLNDFQLQVLRRNINTRFSGAEPLPRSVAAVFEQIDYSSIRDDGFQVLVVDAAGGTTYATKLIARHDANLQERMPETRGFYWERSPHVTIGDPEAAGNPLTEIPYIDHIDGDGHWHDAAPVRKPQPVNQKTLAMTRKSVSSTSASRSRRARCRAACVSTTFSTRGGGALWRDHIPELSAKFRVQGRPRCLPS